MFDICSHIPDIPPAPRKGGYLGYFWRKVTSGFAFCGQGSSGGIGFYSGYLRAYGKTVVEDANSQRLCLTVGPRCLGNQNPDALAGIRYGAGDGKSGLPTGGIGGAGNSLPALNAESRNLDFVWVGIGETRVTDRLNHAALSNRSGLRSLRRISPFVTRSISTAVSACTSLHPFSSERRVEGDMPISFASWSGRSL